MFKPLIQRLIGWHARPEREQYLLRYRAYAVLANLIAPLPVPLGRLFTLFGSDKQKPGWHNYGPAYQALFGRWKYRPLKMLEIGIGGYGESLGGASLLAWQAFFPFGTIHGADIEDKTVLSGWRRPVSILDQSSPEQLTDLKQRHAPFDIVIDDGSHFNAHQIVSFEHLFDAVRDGGIYVIEDVQTSFWPGKVGQATWDGASIADPGFKDTCFGYFLEMAKYLNQDEFLDRAGVNEAFATRARSIRQITFEHNLIIVRKGVNRDGSAFVRRSAG